MSVLQSELAQYKYIKIPEVPTFTGAHIDPIQSFSVLSYTNQTPTNRT